MKISPRTLDALGSLITGEGGTTPYRTGPKLVRFFNSFGGNDSYPQGGGFPSRWAFAEEKLREFNGTPAMREIVEASVNPADFKGTEFDVDKAVATFNERLVTDGFELRRDAARFKVVATSSNIVRLQEIGPAADPLTHDFIHEQIAKCERKLGDGDNDGAITNARALLEAVLREIEFRVTGKCTEAKGDLSKQYKEVQRLLHLEPDRKDIDGSLRQVLSGMVSIVHGIAAARNAMSDAHARTFKPAPHHARLVVNAANTLADFLLASYQSQVARGLIRPDPAP